MTFVLEYVKTLEVLSSLVPRNARVAVIVDAETPTDKSVTRWFTQFKETGSV
jgi:hypothetical protein